MRRAILVAPVLLLIATASAAARCPLITESAASHNVRNGIAHSVCLQDELTSDTQIRAQQARLEAQLQLLREQLREQQRRLQLQQLEQAS